MKKIIHLSDLHIGYDGQKMENNFRSIIENMAIMKVPADNYVVVITGDIVDSANSPANYETAKDLINILKEYGFKVLVVPGNHDYGSGACANKKYVEKFKKCFYENKNMSYPKLDIIDNIAFIGLDSMEEEIKWYDRYGADGELGKVQLNKLDTLLGKDDIVNCSYRVIYLHHHPFAPKFWHSLNDDDKLIKILKKHGNVDAVLFGHNHNYKVWNGTLGVSPRCYDAGSSTRKEDVFSKVRVIDLSQCPKKDYEADFL